MFFEKYECDMASYAHDDNTPHTYDSDSLF